MSTIFTLFMILIIIASILLVIIIMAQNPKGGGLSGTFGGTSAANFGVQRTNDFMEKATWSLGATIVVLIFLSIILTGKPSQVAPSFPTPTKSGAPVQQAPANSAPATTTPAAK
ncbi:preprotein translocase subunit SecG [Chryseobacterium sp. FH1]|uniref:preprotein translocase subunit SecG n=1 Tax=Chryseobacterium sp. FH1 TaxID=1233951 RepID=UPI0004E36E63|nr:preprotein translocase subunit SecG [Chryseobacterium sp. FH1]KFC22931.1 preprotein translocase subunit SecG [Chryseobacterium sp. FH1]